MPRVELLVGILILVIVSIPLAFAIARSTELFVVVVQKGKPRLLRGHAPSRLVDDVMDVLSRAKLSNRATIRCVVHNAHPRIETDDAVPAGTLQQLRNVVGHYSVAQIRSGKRRKH